MDTIARSRPSTSSSPATVREPSGNVAELFKKGNCVACHGPNLSKPIDPSYPKIAGQHAALVLEQRCGLGEKFKLLLLPCELLLNAPRLAGQFRNLGLDGLMRRVEFLRPLSHGLNVGLGHSNVSVDGEQLPAEVAEFALTRDDAGPGQQRPHGQRAIWFQQFPRERDEPQPSPRRACGRLAPPRRAC